MSNSTVDSTTALILADRTQSVDLYRTMCAAIAECARVDQAQEIRNRAKALEEYTRQSKNFETEAQLSAIRLRAERRAGELLIEMAEKGERMPSGGDTRKASLKNIRSLSDLGLKEHESAEWQQLAKIPAPEFEVALAAPGVKRTYKVIAAYRPKQPAAPLKKPAKKQALSEGERQRRFVCEAVIKLANGKARSIQELSNATGRSDIGQFLARARMLPWLTIDRMPDGYRFTVDEELRSICEDHAPRPQLRGAGVHAFIKRLAKEIYRKRKENQEKNNAIKWNPDNTLKTEQKRLLDWIETELSALTQLMASSGPDVMSAIRTQNHPSGDGEREYVLQEKHSNRTIDTRPC